MLWNRFESDKPFLDLYATPHFDPSTGITTVEEAVAAVDKISHPSPTMMKAYACAFVLEHCAIDVNPRCWIGVNFAGRTPKYKKGVNEAIDSVHRKLVKQYMDNYPEADHIRALQRDTSVQYAGSGAHGPDHAHWVPDWDSVMFLGFPGLRERARKYRASFASLTPAQKDYFDSIEIMLSACIRFMERLADLAEKRIDEDPRMPMRVQCLRNLAKDAPRDTYEAIQFIYIFHLVGQFIECAQVRSLGDLDRMLYPYYYRDLYRGAYTKEQIQEILQYFLILYDFQEHRYNQPVSIGGTDIFGKSAYNEMTDVILDAYEAAQLQNLKIHAFVSENTPDEILRRMMDMVRKGHGSFVFMNTDVGLKAMEKVYNMPMKPHMLGSQGCYNFNAKGFPQHANQTRINLPKSIELALFEGVDPLSGHKIGISTPPAEEMKTFEDFKAAFEAQLDDQTRQHLELSDFYDGYMSLINPCPLFSSTFEFSLKEGKDCFEFGPSSILMMGLGTTADCLTMIQKHVFELHTCTLPELREALRNDFEGYEDLRLKLYSDPEKYGNNLERPDAFAVELANGMIGRVTGRKNRRGSQFICHFETIDRCFRSGKVTGATPDGRKARTAYSKNLNAAFGQDRSGITAMILSACKLDMTLMPMGAPVDFMLHPSATKGEEGLDAMVEMLRTFNRLGGYSLQGNVLDADMLRDAQKRPELYKNLQVRVSGWNWNFVDMTKDYQDAFILQAEMNG